MSALKNHFTHHRSHMLGCALAGVLVIAAIVFSIPSSPSSTPYFAGR